MQQIVFVANLVQRQIVRTRIVEAMREVGVLLIAFAPLDATLNGGPALRLGFLLLFLGIGILLFAGAVFLERRRG